MKIRKMTVIAAIAVAGIINASCGNKQQQANSEGATTEVVASGAMEIDSLWQMPVSLLDKRLP